MQQEITPEQHNFTKLADTFKIIVKLTNTTLKITLEDYLDWTIYEREYTDQDIGKEVHRRVELADLYCSLSQVNESDESKMMEMEKVKSEVFGYKFGDVVQISGIPCYKIQKQGQLTVYVNIFDRLSKKQVAFQSNLKLPKKKELSQIEILLKKYERQKCALEKGIFLNIEELKKEKLLQLLQKQQSQHFLDKKHQSQLEQLKKQLKKSNQKLKTNQAKLNQTLEELRKAKLQLTEEYLTLYSIARSIQIGKQQANMQHFNISVNMIELISTDKSKTQYLVHSFIPYNKIYRFKVKIIRCPSGNIAIGVVDFKERKKARTSIQQKSSPSVFYRSYTSSSGYIYEEGQSFKLETLSFRQSQTILITVHLKEGTISWAGQGQKILSRKWEKLKQKSRIFVPSIEFYNQNDIVELVE